MHIDVTPEYLASQGLSESFPYRFLGKIDVNGKTPKHMPHLGKCWKWKAALHDFGYGVIGRGKAGGQHKMIGAHVAMWILVFGPVPKGLCVCHHCDNPQCSNPKHLFIGSRDDNMKNMADKNRSPIGTRNACHKLNDSQVIEIRRLHKEEGITQRRLAVMFNVCFQNISDIINLKLWKHI